MTDKIQTGNILWDASAPIVQTFKADPLVIHPAGREIMRIHADGRITVDESAEPTETARLVLDAMRGLLSEMLQQSYERGYEDATEFYKGGL